MWLAPSPGLSSLLPRWSYGLAGAFGYEGEGQKVVGSGKSLHGALGKQITVASTGGTPHAGALPGRRDSDRRGVGTIRNDSMRAFGRSPPVHGLSTWTSSAF